MKLPFYQVNAFTHRLEGGNPAGVCLLDDMLPDQELQVIASGGTLPEIAFVAGPASKLSIRWFSPRSKVELCGHATLAAAHVLFRHRRVRREQIEFHHGGGSLVARQSGNGIEIELPLRVPEATKASEALVECLGSEPLEVLQATDFLVRLRTEAAVRKLSPNFRRIEQLSRRGVIVTAPGTDVDFVSRYFAPSLGIDEDHVTGSAHCSLVPYWSEQLGKKHMTARQVSPRGGELECELTDASVKLRGGAITFLEGTLNVG